MSAKFKTETVEVTTTVEKKVGIILELTLEEAVIIADILGSVGGNADKTARKYASSILDKLYPLGLRYGSIFYRTRNAIHYEENSLKQVQTEVERLQK